MYKQLQPGDEEFNDVIKQWYVILEINSLEIKTMNNIYIFVIQ